MIGVAEKKVEVKYKGINPQMAQGTIRRADDHASFSDVSESSQVDFQKEEILRVLQSTAHDLRGALVSVMAGLKLLDKGYYGRMDPGVSNEVRSLKSNVAALMGVLEDSLGRAFSLGEGVVYGVQKVNLREDVLDPVLNELATEMHRRNAAFYNGFEPVPKEVLTLRGDCFWLRVIFRNLLRNGLKYGGPTPRLAIGIRYYRDFFLVNIYNSGQPIPEEHRPSLFERVKDFRPQNGEKRGGLGLGLWLVKEAVTKHGGEIQYQARTDGSNFLFSLPRNPGCE